MLCEYCGKDAADVFDLNIYNCWIPETGTVNKEPKFFGEMLVLCDECFEDIIVQCSRIVRRFSGGRVV